MKKLFTLLVFTISFNMNAQWSYPGGNWAMNAQNSTASGDYAAAMGNGTTATGNNSTSMGDNTTASGSASTSMGWWSTASGSASTAMGRFTRASDYASLVIGYYNSSGSSVTNSATSFNTANTAFVIGNGTDDSNRSDAFKVMFNGDTYVSGSLFLGGTEITASVAELNLLDGVSTIGDGILASVTENSDTGVRLSTSNASNHGDIGYKAVDLSFSVSSSSTRGATGDYSLATGSNTTASGSLSSAMGYYTIASGTYSTAIGHFTTASGTDSTAMGYLTTASGSRSTAMGTLTTASGSFSSSMGYNTTASDYSSTVIGQFNSSGSSVTNSATEFNTANTAFVIGNGTDGSNKSDAFKVMFNGDTTVGGDITISSDARLKSNIVSLGATLSKLLLIDGKSYEKDGKQRIGVLAQEIQEVFPELVTEDGNEMLAVNYQGLVPVLINALKEQDKIIKSQEERLTNIEKVIAKLND